MFNINQLLDKFRSLRNSDIGLRMTIQTAIKNSAGMDVPLESLQVKPPKVFIKGISSVARSEIFIKKTAILGAINSAMGSERIKDIS